MDSLLVVALALLVVPVGSWALLRFGRDPAVRGQRTAAGSFVVLVVTLVALVTTGVLLIVAGVDAGVADPVRRTGLRVGAVLIAAGAFYAAAGWWIQRVLARAPEPDRAPRPAPRPAQSPIAVGPAPETDRAR
ncbi:MAG TPA: hypothetical protein VK894_07970 [Jiangellales bacterium]|nr:hypothetical protein [Jiangellales bacterium]